MTRQNSVLTLVRFSFPVASCLFSGLKDQNEVVDYDKTNARHEHNVHMRVAAGIYVMNLYFDCISTLCIRHVCLRVLVQNNGYQRKRDTRMPAYMYTVV